MTCFHISEIIFFNVSGVANEKIVKKNNSIATLRRCICSLWYYDKKAYARTSASVASKAGKMLRSGSSSKGAKSVAGSALSQRRTRR